MAQTTAAEARAAYKIEVSTDASSWTDISGQSNSYKQDGGDQITGSAHTADGTAPVVTHSNKTELVTLTCSCLYTETASQAWRLVKDRYDGAAKTIAVRVTPKGGATGERRYVTANDAGTAIVVPIKSIRIPEGDAGSGDPLMFEFSVEAPKLLEEATP